MEPLGVYVTIQGVMAIGTLLVGGCASAYVGTKIGIALTSKLDEIKTKHSFNK